jgi:hypothetical protein
MRPLFVTHRAFFHALRCLARGGTQRAADIIFGYFSGARGSHAIASFRTSGFELRAG